MANTYRYIYHMPVRSSILNTINIMIYIYNMITTSSPISRISYINNCSRCNWINIWSMTSTREIYSSMKFSASPAIVTSNITISYRHISTISTYWNSSTIRRTSRTRTSSSSSLSISLIYHSLTLRFSLIIRTPHNLSHIINQTNSSSILFILTKHTFRYLFYFLT